MHVVRQFREQIARNVHHVGMQTTYDIIICRFASQICKYINKELLQGESVEVMNKAKEKILKELNDLIDEEELPRDTSSFTEKPYFVLFQQDLFS
jgi:hypothetical protein